MAGCELDAHRLIETGRSGTWPQACGPVCPVFQGGICR